MKSRTWQVGAVRITRVIELIAERPPEFGFRNLSPSDIEEQTWLRPHFVTDQGRLRTAIQTFIVESDGLRIVVDTCVGDGKPRNNPGFNELQTGFLTRLEQSGFALDSVNVVLCTHLHVDHVGYEEGPNGAYTVEGEFTVDTGPCAGDSGGPAFAADGRAVDPYLYLRR